MGTPFYIGILGIVYNVIICEFIRNGKDIIKFLKYWSIFSTITGPINYLQSIYVNQNKFGLGFSKPNVITTLILIISIMYSIQLYQIYQLKIKSWTELNKNNGIRNYNKEMWLITGIYILLTILIYPYVKIEQNKLFH